MGRFVLGLHPVESALIDLDITFQTKGLHLVHIALPGRIVVHVQLALDELGAVNIVAVGDQIRRQGAEFLALFGGEVELPGDLIHIGFQIFRGFQVYAAAFRSAEELVLDENRQRAGSVGRNGGDDLVVGILGGNLIENFLIVSGQTVFVVVEVLALRSRLAQ